MPEYQSPEGRHRHQCEGCDFIWEHNDSPLMGRAEDHVCPRCGRERWWKYYGADPPTATVQPERSV